MRIGRREFITLFGGMALDLVVPPSLLVRADEVIEWGSPVATSISAGWMVYDEH